MFQQPPQHAHSLESLEGRRQPSLVPIKEKEAPMVNESFLAENLRFATIEQPIVRKKTFKIDAPPILSSSF
jgi:hypothetical protein